MPEASISTTIRDYRQPGNDVKHCGDVSRWSRHHQWEKIIDLP